MKKFLRTTPNTLSNSQKGFTLVELLLAISIISILFGLITINLVNVQHNTNVATAEESLIADIKAQQMKAMSGSNGTNGSSYFGIHFDGTNTYTLFQGSTYASAIKSPVTIDSGINYVGNEIIFSGPSGEIVSYTTARTVVINSASGSETKTITLDRYGAVIGQ